MAYLETERLILRKVSQDDYSYFRNYLQDKEMDRLMFRSPCETEEDVRQMFEWFLHKEKRAYAIVHKKCGKTIGNLTVYEFPPALVAGHPKTYGKKGRALSYAIGWQWQRQGYIREILSAVITRLFEEENVDYINSGFLSFNEPSKCLHEKLGFKFLLKETVEVDGQSYTAVETVLFNPASL